MSIKVACEYADAEIASQPSIWAQVADFAPSSLHLLPEKGEKVAVVGCGSSWFMSMAYASLREAASLGETDVYVGSEMNYGRKYDRIISISRSGTTTEIVKMLKNTKKDKKVFIRQKTTKNKGSCN